MKKLFVLLFLSFISLCAYAQTAAKSVWDFESKIDPYSAPIASEHKLMVVSAEMLTEAPMPCYVKKVDIEGEPLKYFICFQSDKKMYEAPQEMPIELSEVKEIIAIINRLNARGVSRGIIGDGFEISYATESFNLRWRGVAHYNGKS